MTVTKPEPWLNVLVASLMFILTSCAASPGATVPTFHPSAQPTATSAATPSSASPALPLPGGHLVFDRLTGDAGPEGQYVGTFIAAPDGTNERQVRLPVTADDIGLLPVWSPDGRRMLVNVLPGYPKPTEPAIINADGTGFHFMNQAALKQFECSGWSPDGTALLCSTNSLTHARNGIYRIKADGTGLVQLTVSPFDPTQDCGGGDSRAKFSPDGKTIAFIRQECSQPETGAIVVARADGRDQRDVVHQGGVRTHAGSQLSWSPDGRWILFGTQDLQLEAVHPDGSGLHQITLDPLLGLTALGPSWSPDGTRIVFSAAGANLYVVAPDGSSLVKVTGSQPGEFNVDWGR